MVDGIIPVSQMRQLYLREVKNLPPVTQALIQSQICIALKSTPTEPHQKICISLLCIFQNSDDSESYQDPIVSSEVGENRGT